HARCPCGVTGQGTGITEKIKIGSSVTTNLAPFHPNVSVNLAFFQGFRGYIEAAFKGKMLPSTSKLVSPPANNPHFNNFLWINHNGQLVDGEGYGDFNKIVKEAVFSINKNREAKRCGKKLIPFTGQQHRHMFNQLVKDAVGQHEEERRGQVAREGRMEGAMAGHARATGSEYTNSGTYSNGTHGSVIDDDANLLFIIIDIVWTGCLGVGNRYTGEHSV
ncbi:hypothetical protein TrRE_jg7498, partial [Triparma retinervis]